jgi:hypothetical protein
MGRLAGFSHRDVVRKPKVFGFEFDRQATGSHEIGSMLLESTYDRIPNHPGDLTEETLKAKRFLETAADGAADWLVTFNVRHLAAGAGLKPNWGLDLAQLSNPQRRPSATQSSESPYCAE